MLINQLVNNDLTINWGVVKTIDCFNALKKTPHSERWHKEGNPLEHTKLTTVKLRELLFDAYDAEFISEKNGIFRAIMCAMLCHDLGKATTTLWDDEKQDWACRNHGLVGSKITRNLLIDEDIQLREFVCNLVRWHMTLHHILEKPSEDQVREILKLSHSNYLQSFEPIYYITYADSLGSINEEDDFDIIDKFHQIKIIAMAVQCWKKRKLEPVRYFFGKAQKVTYFRKQPWELSHTYRPYQTLTLYIGLAGSGKDTAISTDVKYNTVVLCRDDIRKEIGLKGDKPQGTKSEEQKVTDIFNERLVDAFLQGKSVIINNTNLKKKYRNGYLDILTEHNIVPEKVIYHYVEAPSPVDDCIKRRKGQIKPSIITKMWEDFDFPDYTECDYLFLHKQTNND